MSTASTSSPSSATQASTGASSRRIIGFINIAHVIDHMFMLIFPTAVLGMSAAFGKSYADLLALSLGGFIAFGAGSIPAGWIGDKWSRRHMMAVFFIGIGVAAMLTSMSTSPLWLAAGLTLIGLFGSIYHPIGTAMLTAHAEKLGRDIGINGVWGNLGVALAALITGAFTQFFGWRTAFAVPGLIAVIIGLVYLRMVPAVSSTPTHVRPAAPSVPRNIAIRAFAVLAVVSVSGSIIFNATTVSMPKLFAERLDALTSTPFGIGILVSVVYVLGAMSQLLVGRLLDRYTLRDVFLPLSLLQAPCLLLAAFAHEWTLLLVAVAMMFAIFGQITINDTMVAKYTSDAWRARAYAIRYFMSFGAAACAVPLIAWLHKRTGDFELAFKVLAVFGLLVFLGALFFPRRPQELDHAPAKAANQTG